MIVSINIIEFVQFANKWEKLSAQMKSVLQLQWGFAPFSHLSNLFADMLIWLKLVASRENKFLLAFMAINS